MLCSLKKYCMLSYQFCLPGPTYRIIPKPFEKVLPREVCLSCSCPHPQATAISRNQNCLSTKENLSWGGAASLGDFRPSPVLGLQEKNTPLALTQGNDLCQPKSCACPAVHLHDRLLTHHASTAPSVSSPWCSETLITLRVDEI